MGSTVSAGDVVAEKYRVERLLGRGGMGYVVSARHLSLDELFAIKFLRRSAATDEDAVARFRREAKACAVLRNDHVARVFDVGLHNDEPFIVMEHLQGRDLGRTVVSAADACEYIIQACEGLAEAHALGIVHRDIKLPNLFLTKTASGAPLIKVLDFGVSKSGIAGQHDVTQTTTVLGSPKYMSPEQMTDPRDVDARSDVWSLGVCLYRLISGVAPFDAETIGRLCTMVLHEPPIPLQDLRPDLGIAPHVEAIVSVCLQKDRRNRFRNVAELAASLAPFTNDPISSADRAARIACVLGVPVPPAGYLPEQLLSRFQTSSSSSLEGASGWAHNMVDARKQKQRGELVLALVAAGAALALLFVGVSVFATSHQPAKSASSSEPPPPTTAIFTTPPPTATVIAPPPPPHPIPTPTLAPSPAPRRHAGAVSIPADRK